MKKYGADRSAVNLIVAGTETIGAASKFTRLLSDKMVSLRERRLPRDLLSTPLMTWSRRLLLCWHL